MGAPASFKERLRAGDAAIGCWIELFSPLASEVVAEAGYDCVLIDLEHGPGSVMDAIKVMQAIQGKPCSPLVRVPHNDPTWIKRVLDAGAIGCMVPGVNSANDAEAAVAACRFPPKGRRGLATPIVRASRFGLAEADYLAHADADILVICQVETGTAVENVESIAAVDGVDMLFVGPYDLSADLGYLGSPDEGPVRAAIEQIEGVARRSGILLGGIPTPGRSATELRAAGYQLVLAGVDSLLLRDAAQATVKAFRAAKDKV